MIPIQQKISLRLFSKRVFYKVVFGLVDEEEDKPLLCETLAFCRHHDPRSGL